MQPLYCELCNASMPSQDAMHHHLVQVHQLTSAKWNMSRDSLDGQPACSHCGQVFTCMESVRSHISQSKCGSFDPSLTSEPKAVDELWIAAMCRGALLEPHNRQRLTLQCQFCEKTWLRASDLALHLQSAHTQVWAYSEGLAHLLVSMLYESKGCQCNP